MMGLSGLVILRYCSHKGASGIFLVPPGSPVLPVQHAVRQIRNHGIDASVGYLLHPFQAVHVVYLVLLHFRLVYCFWFPFTKYTKVPYFSLTLFFLMALLMALLVFW